MKILLAIDDSKFSAAAAKAVLTLVPPAGTVVRVLHVLEPLVVRGGLGMSGYTAANLEGIWKARRDNAHALVRRVAERLRGKGFKVLTSVVRGEPRGRIVDVASKWKADLIVIGSHGRRGLGRFLLGSVSEAVVRHAPCSVHVVRLGSAD